MSNLVVYKDEMNTVPLRNFNSKEMDLFFSICSKMRNEELNTVTFNFEDLRELSNYKMTATNHFISDLESIYSKLIQLDYRMETEEKIIKFVLFTRYEIDKINQTMSIRVNEEFKHILNNIFGGFTKFELEEFTMLKSSYSKTAYRLLKQFRSTGYYIVQIDEFKRLFDVPESYQMYNITQRILEPIEKELSQYFKNLKINKLRGRGKRKRFIEHIEFKFKPETDIHNGKKTFRDKETGEYYEKDIMDFDDTEVNKAFPEAKPLSEQIPLSRQMGIPEGVFTKKQLEGIYAIAMKKIKETGASISLHGYVYFYWEYERTQKADKKYNYLISCLLNDWENRLGQQTIL